MLIFQNYNLIDYMTPIENTKLVSKVDAVPILQRLGLTEDELRRTVLKLSGGQQQRVAVARAIAAKPPVILADEPTGNLDTKSTKEVMAILHELKDEGRTVIVITHDNEIAEEAERVIRIRDGKVVEDYINPGYEEKYGRESKKNNKNPIDEG